MKKILASLTPRRRAEPDPDEEETSGRLRLRGLRLFHFGLAAGVGAVVVVAAAVAAAYLQYEQGVAQRAAQVPQHVAGRLAARIGPRVDGYREAVAVAAGRPVVREAIGAGSAAREAAAAEVVATLPGARHARLLPAGADGEGLGYAGRALLQQAVERGKPAPVEVLDVAGDASYLAVAAPVAGGGGTVAGTLLVAVDPARIDGWLGGLSGLGGYAELRQGGLDGALLAQAGDPGRKGAAAPVTRAIPGTSWQLGYWPAPVAGVSRAEQIRFAAIGGAAMAVMLVLALGVTVGLGRRLRQDLNGMVRHCEELLGGRRSHAFAPRLLDVKRAALAAEQLIERVRRPQVAETPPPPPSADGMLVEHGDMPMTEAGEGGPSAPAAGSEGKNDAS